MGQNKWDAYFLKVAIEVGANSKCLSRQIGAILVRDKSIISTGYNGPARGIPHCHERRDIPELEVVSKDFELRQCPRRLLGFGSGQGLYLCHAVHAEINAISNAARNGVSTIGSVLYLSGGILPCVHCMSTIINAGIVEVDEIASGINEKRNGIHKLIKMCFEGKVERILIEYKDRLARFGYEYLDAIFKNLEITVEVVETKEKKYEEELAEDIMKILTCYSARFYGRRVCEDYEMIKNNRQYRITRSQSRKFEEALRQLQTKGSKLHPVLQKAQKEAILSQLEDLRAEMREYEALRSGIVDLSEIEYIEELPEAIIKARIASGLTQKNLAEQIGLKEQQIQRYEATDYKTASFGRLLEIANILNLKLKQIASPLEGKLSLANLSRRMKGTGIDPNFILRRLVPSNLVPYLESSGADEEATCD